jgi:hypothetical protein
MPIYNNPAVGQAFDKIASMFAPPSGSDAAGWAMANAKNAEAARISELYADPNAADFDRRAVAAGVYTPSQSYYAVDRGNNVTMRGQDIGSADARYGTDVGARTSIANNTADNATTVRGQDLTASTSLATNAADNARAIAGNRLAGLAGLFGPLNEGQVRPALPAAIASQFGAPGMIEQADGRTKPLSETEMVAQIMAEQPVDVQRRFVADKFAPTETQVEGQDRRRLVESGQLSDQDIQDAITGAQTPVEIIGANGKPAYSTPGAAVRTGAAPYDKPSSALVNVNTGDAADGKLRGKLDENEGKRLSDLQAAAVTSAGLSQDLDLMSQLIDQAPQGPLVGRLAAALPGFSDAATAFDSIVQRAAPGLRVEGSGSTSDIEFKGMLNSLPQLRNRPEANRLIAGMMKAKADINIRRGEIVTAYQNGELDASQMRQRLAGLNRQSIASPALSAMIDAVGGGAEPLTPTAPAADDTMSPGTILDGHRFKGGDPAVEANWEPL